MSFDRTRAEREEMLTAVTYRFRTGECDEKEYRRVAGMLGARANEIEDTINDFNSSKNKGV